MLTLASPLWLWLLPLPALVLLLAPGRGERRAALSVPFMARLVSLTGRLPAAGAAIPRASVWQRALAIACWILFLLAVARPQRIEEPITKTLPARDMLLAVDLSGSMDTEDFTDASGAQVDRLTAIKGVLDGFLARRKGDRVGLIVFGSAAFVQAPFTEDTDVCRTLLREAQVRMAGPQTKLGDAIGLAINVFAESDVDAKVLIMLTDGNDTGSKVPPLQAADIAADEGVTVHTIAVGDPAAAGEEKLDEETLRDIAKRTGGGYYRAEDREGLEGIYDQLDALETRELETLSYRPTTDLFYWPVALGLLLVLLYHLLQLDRRSPMGMALASGALIFGGAGLVSLGGEGASGFHFARPWALSGLLPMAVFTWHLLRRQDQARAWKGVVEPHLLRHLVTGGAQERGPGPVTVLAAALALGSVAAAGPSWRKEPSPFTQDTAALVVVLRVAQSMETQDVAPSRQERAAHKVKDLLALRPGGANALVVYGGSAHRAMPLTRDAALITRFAAALSSDVMPAEGEALEEALDLADEELRRSGRAGALLLITDDVSPQARELVTERAKARAAPLHVLGVAGAAALERARLSEVGQSFEAVSADDSDVRALAGRVEASLEDAPAGETDRWRDEGYWLTPLLALFALLWFRPGWVVRWD